MLRLCEAREDWNHACFENLVWWCGLTDTHAHQHNLTDLTVRSCNIEYLLGHSSKGTVDSAPLASVHYLPVADLGG